MTLSSLRHSKRDRDQFKIFYRKSSMQRYSSPFMFSCPVIGCGDVVHLNGIHFLQLIQLHQIPPTLHHQQQLLKNSPIKTAALAQASSTTDLHVAIIGAGFSGIGMGHRLLKAGFGDFLIFERAKGLGGTWRDNVYPGAECDIPTDLYSYSFAPSREWSGSYAPQTEILNYLRTCAHQFELADHFRFQHELKTATWNSAKNHWVLTTSQGTYTAKILVGAMGYLCEPKYPDIKGLQRFSGTVMHSSRWDPGTDLNGKRVAVIGTGASAIQIVPSIQPLVEQLDVYQRTPPWIMSKHGHTYGPWESWAFRKLPGYHFLMRQYHRLTAEMVTWQLGRPYRAISDEENRIRASQEVGQRSRIAQEAHAQLYHWLSQNFVL